ncbi:MAG TPA: arabinofuranosidase catalytic domain-containing protein [Polyangiaceae bacterium]
MSSSVRLGLATICMFFVPTESACTPIKDIAGDLDAGTVGGQTSTGGTQALGGGSGSTTGGASAVVVGLPCDVLEGAGNPCVAAHSTVRLLSSHYSGPLYQVQRTSDRTTQDIGAVDGYADAAALDAFCARTNCTVSVIYDQSMHDNELTIAPPGGAKPTFGKPVDASDLKVAVNGHSVDGLLFRPGMGYRKLVGNGTANGDEPETIYMVTSQNDLTNGCCFDYGNAETTAHDDGNGAAEAVYFGKGVVWGSGSGTGPWVMADLENGLYAGWEFNQDRNISTNTPLNYDYVTAVLVGDTADKNGGKGRFALYGGDATSGTVQTMWDGTRPTKIGYVPMKKQGSIVLSTAGDNSDGDGGRFYEGVIATGAATKGTVDALQASIVAAKYGSGASSMGGQPGTGGASSTGGAGTGGSTSCSNATPCGGDLVGTWTVTSSCQAVTGEVDLSVLGLGCSSAPVTGLHAVTGTFTAYADGTYEDNTITTGSEQLTLAPSCLNISGTQAPCEAVAQTFSALGYASASCTPATDGCSCQVVVDQQGGIGIVSPLLATSGSYSTSGNVLTLLDASSTTSAPYSYCVTADTLTIAPQPPMPTITGTIALQKQ